MSARDLSRPAEKATPDGAASTRQEWTCGDHAEMVRLAATGARAGEIAAALGKTRNAVIGYARRKHIALTYKSPPAAPKPPRPPGLGRGYRYPPETVAKVREMWAAGATTGAVVAALGVPAGSISWITAGLPRRREITWSTKRKDHAFRVAALAAVLTGEPYRKAGKRLGVSPKTTFSWKRDLALLAEATSLAARIKARWAEQQEAERLREAAEREAEAVRVATANAPVLAKMGSRARSMMQRRVAGESLQSIGDDFGVTRERVRQIEVSWRKRGLIVPGAQPLSEASLRLGVYVSNGRRPGRPGKVVVKDAAFWSAKVAEAFAQGVGR